MNVKEKAGDFILDLAKLVFGGVILGSIMGENLNPVILYGLGLFFLVFAITMGFALISNSERR